MRHPTEGVLRRLLDEPAGVAEPDRLHVADCAHCLASLVALREDAASVGAALTSDASEGVDVSAAWQRLAAATTTAQGRLASPRARRSAALVRRPAAAVVAVAVVLTGASAAAANDWLPIFRTESIAPVGFTTDDLVTLPDLDAYGELEVTREPDVGSVPDAASAAARTGLEVPEVAELPSGVNGEPVYQVGGQAIATFTFSAERAAETAAAGTVLPPAPPGLDGSSVRLVAGPGVAQLWTSASGAPALVVGRAVAPSAFSSGVPFETLRDYVLSLPGLPDDVAAQLRTFGADGTTLPLPVPADEVTSSSTEVDGVPVTVLETRDRALAAVVWVDDGLVTVVAGSLDSGELLTVARELR